MKFIDNQVKKFKKLKQAHFTKKKITIALGVLVGLTVAWYAGAGAFLHDVFSSRAGGAVGPEEENIDISALQEPGKCSDLYPWGTPKVKDNEVNQRSLYLCKNAYASQYDTKIHVPLWEVEILNKRNLVAFNIPKSIVPSLDPTLPKKMQPALSQYQHGGYTMGFLAPIENMYINNQNMPDQQLESVNKQSLSESLYVTNALPMAPGTKAMLEQIDAQVRNMVMERNELFLVAGPVYLNGKTKGEIGPEDKQIAIPTHIFRLITDPLTYGSIGYVIPNDGSVVCQPNNCDFDRYIVPIREVERVTGIEFYSKLAPFYAVQVKQDINLIFKDKNKIKQ